MVDIPLSSVVAKRRAAGKVVAHDLDYVCVALREELPKLEGKHLLITGGGGFLGYYIVQAAVRWNQSHAAKPIRITVIDNFAQGYPAWLDELASRCELAVLRHDITQPLPRDLLPFSYGIHAASVASPAFYRKHPIETMDANVDGLRNLLHLSILNGHRDEVEGLLFFSSSEIYGHPPPDQIPTPETYWGHVSCTGPRACYDESKRYGETLSVNFHRVHGVPIRIARPFNNYGPGLRLADGRALSDFVGDVLAGRPIVLFSDGTPTRTFCYVADAIIGYFKVLIRGRSGEAYNIGVDFPEISISGLAEKVIEQAVDLFGYSGHLIFRTSDDVDYLVDNPCRRCPCIDKARRELAYEPQTDIDHGVRRSLIWYHSNG